MKSSFESQPDIKLAFLWWAKREKVREADRGEMRRTGCGPVTLHAAGWHAEESQVIISTTKREQETGSLLTHTCAQTSKGTKSKCRVPIYTHSTAVHVDTHRHTRWAGNKTANNSQGQRDCCPESAKQQLILPVWSLQRVMEIGQQFSLTQDREGY